MAFNVVKVPAKNVNDTGQPKPADIDPSKDDPSKNGDVIDETPDHPPEIKWPPAAPPQHKPFKF